MRSSLRTILAMTALAACGKAAPKDEAATKTAEPTATPAATPTAAVATAKPGESPTAATAQPNPTGVEAGGVQHEASEGPAAVVKSVTGTVEIQRLGETARAAAKLDTKLYPGDRVITGDASVAILGMADTSVVEISEASTLAIASRDGTADPASAAAVLSGVARFTVASRAPGEGPFRVYTPAGIAVAHGTVYGVGVDASGAARVGVESGSVDIVGLSALDAAPVSLIAGTSVELAAAGTVASPAPWTANDWGTWRDSADASIDLGTAVDAHAAAITALDAQLAATYIALDTSANEVATFEASAGASADAKDSAAYTTALPDGAASIDASFALGARAEALTWATAAHGQIAADLYVRNPDIVTPHWAAVAPRIDASLLWPKRFEVTASGYLEPLRMQYYVHTPRGRAHAELVGVTVPTFYAAVEPPAVEPAQIRAHAHVELWIPPPLEFEASARPIWITAPAPDWSASAHWAVAIDANPHAQLAWYVRPPAPHLHAVVGMPVTAEWHSALHVGAPSPRATLAAGWRVPVGVHVHIGAPDIRAGLAARAAYGGSAHVHAGAVVVPPSANVHVDVPDPSVRVHAAAGAAANAAASVRGSVKAAAKVRVQAPSVKVKVKVPSINIHGGAGISIH